MTSSSAPAEPGEAIAIDLPCSICEYNLRSLTKGDVCPECGHPTRLSCEPDRLIFADRGWLRGLLTGVRNALLTLFVSGLIAGAFLVGGASFPCFLLGAVPVAVGCTIAWIAAVWFLTAPRPIEQGRRRPARTWWIIGLSCASFAAMPIFFPMFSLFVQDRSADGAPSMVYFVASMAAQLLGPASGLCAIMLGLGHLRSLVRHERSPGLRRMMMLLIWGLGAMASACVVFGLSAVYFLSSAFYSSDPAIGATTVPPVASGVAVASVPTANQAINPVGTSDGDFEESGDSGAVVGRIAASPPIDATPAPAPASQPVRPTTPLALLHVLAPVLWIVLLGWYVCAAVALLSLRRLLVHSIEHNLGDTFRQSSENATASPEAQPSGTKT